MPDCIIKFVKYHPDAQLPTMGHEGDNCYDLYACVDAVVYPSLCNSVSCGVDVGCTLVPVGLKVGSISPGYGFVIRGRSGLAFKSGLMPHFGEIDNGYRGSIDIKVYNFTSQKHFVKKGDRIAQIKVEKNWNTRVEFTEEQVDSSRGEGGFGSTGA